jgi:methylenetetrahydrofolate reductase (NADPH)
MDLVENNRLPQADRQRIGHTLARFARTASLEATPARVMRGAALTAQLPARARVYVPFLPGTDFLETVAACRRLLGDGLRPVPHLPARAVPGKDALDDWLAALAATGTSELLLIAGDQRAAAGPFPDTLKLLETGKLLEHGFRRLGVAGHPEGSPHAACGQLDAALESKLAYARDTDTRLWIVSQFTFSSSPIIEWLAHIRERGVDVPVYAGIPGPARLQTLIAYAARCGVGVSARVLRRRPGAARLLGRWTPHGVAADLAGHAATDSVSGPDGIHVFPFGGIADAAAWLRTLGDEGGCVDMPATDEYGSA